MCYVPIDNNEYGMSIEDRHKTLVLYFKGLDRIGVPYGTNELTKKAKELRLPVPSKEEMELWKTDLKSRHREDP